jgi:hypothetical protein
MTCLSGDFGLPPNESEDEGIGAAFFNESCEEVE